jgi:carboxymethylenebutenolidase
MISRCTKVNGLCYLFITYVDSDKNSTTGTTHGFAARPNLDVPELKEAYQKAFEQVVGWFNKTLFV